MPMIFRALAEHGCSRQELPEQEGQIGIAVRAHIIPPPQPTAASRQAHLEMTFS